MDDKVDKDVFDDDSVALIFDLLDSRTIRKSRMVNWKLDERMASRDLQDIADQCVAYLHTVGGPNGKTSDAITLEHNTGKYLVAPSVFRYFSLKGEPNVRYHTDNEIHETEDGKFIVKKLCTRRNLRRCRKETLKTKNF